MTHSMETDKQKWRYEGGQDHQLYLTEADLGQVESDRLRDRTDSGEGRPVKYGSRQKRT